MHWNEVWHSERPSARLIRTLLTPLSWLYAASWEIYLTLYRTGIKKAKEPHHPVICVGNLVSGGSGKSPITLYVARLLLAMSREVVIGCSGYGSPKSESATVAPGGHLDSAVWGDEPAMFRWLAPEFPLVVGRDRVRAASICHESHPTAVLLMDDGFQHLPLRKHITIVLDPPTNNARCIPAGPYRELRKNRNRADLCLPNGFKASMRTVCLASPKGELVTLVPGCAVNALCALGDPARFLEDLVGLGLHVEKAKVLPDHDSLQMGNLFESVDPALPLIVTAKDWVKLQRRSDLGSRQILIARQEARIEPEEEFKAWLTRKLDELSNKRPSP